MDANRTRSRTVSVEAKPEPITIICDSQQFSPTVEVTLEPNALGYADLAIDRRLGEWRSSECVARN